MEHDRNPRYVKANWRFTSNDAHIIFENLVPSVPMARATSDLSDKPR
jgi:hypothetical protein